MMDLAIPPTGPFTLTNVTLLDPSIVGVEPGRRIDLTISGGRLSNPIPDVLRIDVGGAVALPTFVDMHTHLDKGHIWPRTPNPDGTFAGALAAVAADRQAHWTAEDVRCRMDFALRCAWAHGTSAIRTHIDSSPPQDIVSWHTFCELREDWRGRIDLQASCLVGLGRIEEDGAFAKTADLVAQSSGVLGCATYPFRAAEIHLQTVFRMAEARGLSVDIHVDETMDPSSAFLRLIAQTVLDMGFEAPVVVGHCCSLAMQKEVDALRTLDLVAKAGLHVVSLPMCNAYLQDRENGRTPRWRGITLVHEMVARGINVSFASDNTRDPFYPYGDHDMIEVMREAVRLCQIDHSTHNWIQAFNLNPARACGFEQPSFNIGAKANLLICRSRNWTELLSRPQADRIVLRDGRQIDRTLPAYSELDERIC